MKKLQSDTGITVIDDNSFIIGSSINHGKASALVGAETIQRNQALFEPTTEIATVDKYKYIKTNTDDNKPYLIKQALDNNAIVSACLDKRWKIVSANGIRYGTIVSDNNSPDETFIPQRADAVVNQFFDNNNLQAQYLETTLDFVACGYSFVEFIRNKELTQIVQINHLEAYMSRVTEPDKDKNQLHLYAPDWTKPKPEDIKITPLLDTKNPIIDLLKRTGKMPNDKGVTLDDKQPRYVMMIRTPSWGNSYYTPARWHSIITSGWLDINNNIPKFKAAIMQNEANVQFLVEMHPDYMKAIFEDENITDRTKQKQRTKQEMRNLQSFISGNDKTGKSIVTGYKVMDGKRWELLKITPIPRSDANTKYELDAQESGAMICMAFGLHPDLLGRIPGLASSNISGTNARELFNIESTLSNSLRELLLQPLYAVKKYNQWNDDIVFRFMYTQQNTLDTGKETSTMA